MNFDIAIVVGFLTITLIVGLYSGRGIKTLKDYALGSRNFSTAAIVSTLIATWISGGSFSFYMAETYIQGLYFIIAIIADACSFLIIAYAFAPKVKDCLGKLSVAQVMGDLYGKNVRIITAITGFIGTVGALAIQFKIFSNILQYFLAIPTIYSAVISSLVVIIYSTFGGIKSVTFTDIIQILTFSVVIPIIGFAIWGTIDNVEAISNLTNVNSNFDYRQVFDYTNPKFLGALAIFVYFLIPGFSPSTFQRISMSKDIEQTKRAFLLAGVGLLIIELLIAWIAVLVLVKNSNVEPYSILNYIIDNYSYSGLKGLIIIGIMAMVMSTADSYISSAAVLFSHDFCEPLGLVKKNNKLFFSRAFCLVIGTAAIFISIKVDSIFSLFLLGYGPYMTIVTVPFMLSILGFKTTTKPIMLAMISGITASMLWKNFSASDVDDTVLGMIANLIVLLISHYWYRTPSKFRQSNDRFIHRVFISIYNRIKKFFNIKNFDFTNFCTRTIPKHEYYYPLVAVFFIISIFSTIYSMPQSISLQHIVVIRNLYYSALIISSGFLTYPLWPQKLKNTKYVAIFWISGLIYNMVFVSSLLAIISKFNQIHLMILVINLIILATLLSWKMTLFSIIIGIFCSLQMYEYLYDNINFDTIQLQIVYLIFLVSSVLIAFFKPKQEHQEATEQKVGTLETEVIHYNQRINDQEKEIHRLGATAQKILNNVNHELRLPIGNVVNFAEMLNEGLEKYSKNQLKELSDEVLKNSTRLSSMILNMLDLATLSARTIKLQKKTLNLGLLVEERVKTCRNIYLQKKKLDFELSIAQNLLIDVDPNYIRQTVDNLVINAITFSEKGVIKISLTKQQNVAVFVITNEGKPIPHTELHDIFTAFRMASNTESKAEGRGVGLALCKAAIEAHGGMIKAENTGKGAKFRFVLPL